MKIYLTILYCLFCSVTIGQNCFCETDSTLNETISCDTIKFDNNAKLFWNFDCNESWLTFKSPQGIDSVIYSLELVPLTGMLGYIYRTEYKNTFLIQNNVISGCCSPPDFYLYDKFTGELKVYLGRTIFYGEDEKMPFIIGITNSNYDKSSTGEYDSLTIYNIDQDKKYFIELPKGQIEKALEEREKMYPEYLFDKPVINGLMITLKYHIKLEPEDSIKEIVIDLTKFGKK